MNDSQIQRLEGLLGAAQVSVGADIDAKYGADASSEMPVMPEVLCLPTEAAQLDALLAFAAAESIPVTPRGAGSGKVGGCIPASRGIVLSMEQMTQIIECDHANKVLACEAGAITGEIQQCVASQGLFYPPDPASLAYCTIGGNVATNAGGPRAYKYGVTRHYVQQLKVHQMGGNALSLGGKSLKRQSGLDLLQLVVGSEGTLGVVSEVTLRLLPLPKNTAQTYLLLADSLEVACKLVQSIDGAAGRRPSAAELIDADVIAQSRAQSRLPLALTEGKAVVLLEYDDFEHDGCSQIDQTQVDHARDALQAYARAENATMLHVIAPDLRDAVWSWRRQISTMLTEAFVFKTSEDIVVPPKEMPAIVAFAKDLGSQSDLHIVCYGHAGDGNIHVNILSDQVPAKGVLGGVRQRLFAEVIQRGGHLSGEHGIGSKKRPYMNLAHSNNELQLMAALKQSWDPQGLLNPGKIWPR